MERELLDAIAGYREQIVQLRELCSDAAAPSAEAQEARQVQTAAASSPRLPRQAAAEALRRPPRVRS
jgi:hypothetical protein